MFALKFEPDVMGEEIDGPFTEQKDSKDSKETKPKYSQQVARTLV